MAKRSLFSILSGQPWWLTLLVALLIFSVMQFVFPPLAPFIALPFALVVPGAQVPLDRLVPDA